jgi:sensor histidine kinase YesM
MNFLYAQIQPHFLYNTINTIIAYCRTDPEQSRKLLIELSTYLRGKFKNKKDMYTSLSDEIELIKSYLTIEQIRFKDRLSVEYDIDDECNMLIPCLLLQPIVENAVKHGLIPKKEGGKLSISVKREDDSIVVRIKDNGIGMDIKRLPDILQGSENETGIGLGNTNERLKQYYNTQIKAQSEIGKGTQITVTIPISRGKKI